MAGEKHVRCGDHCPCYLDGFRAGRVDLAERIGEQLLAFASHAQHWSSGTPNPRQRQHKQHP